MKRLLVSWICALSALLSSAQNLSVSSFRLLENSTLANMHGTERFDRNGDKCAIIRVIRPRPGFLFDTGRMHLAHQEDPKDHAGETWLWVSPDLQRITVSHETFGRCQYEFPAPVEGGRTYEMLLDIGTGRFVNITTNVARSAVVVDGEEIGQAPIYNHYLDMGVHDILATNNKFEGSLQKVITTNDANGLVLNVVMEDQSPYFGDVVVSVEGGADIHFNGKKVETGQWRTQLKQGTYTVETHQADCDPQKTTFQVMAGRENRIDAIAPIPHTGYLHIFTRPRNVSATLDGTEPIDLIARQVVNVGTHQLQIQKKGYVTQTREYQVRRYETTKDTVQLEHIKYIKPLAFYFGGGYALRSMGGATGILGAVIKNHDVQLSYTFGLTKSDPIHWYDNGVWVSTSTYKQNTLALKYGYQFNLMRLLAITPQVGYGYTHFSGDVTDGTQLYADKASAHLASIGVKLLLVPIHHLYVFAAPQFDIAVGKSTNYNLLADHSDISAGGFSATMGLLFNF